VNVGQIWGTGTTGYGNRGYGWPACYRSDRLWIESPKFKHEFSIWELAFAVGPAGIKDSRFSSLAVLVNAFLFVAGIGILGCIDVCLQRRRYSLKTLLVLLFFISLLLAAATQIEKARVEEFYL
jgi:hypothetical protein